MIKFARKASVTVSIALLLASSAGFVTPAIAGIVPNHLLDPQAAGAAASDARLDQAYDALRKGDIEQAAASFSERLRVAPDDPAALLGMAAVEQARENGDAALGWMRRALMISPDDPALLHANARLLLEQKQPDEAVLSLEHAVRADPDAFEPRRELAALLMQLGRPGEAIPHYRKLHEMKPTEAQPAAELGVALVTAGKFAEGASLLEPVLPRVPGDLTVMNALGHAWLRQGRHADALRLFDRLIAANKSYPPAWLARGDALMNLERLAEASESYLQAERLSRAPLAALKRGVVLEKLGRAADAEAAYKSALKLDPDYGPAYNNLAFLVATQPARRDDALAWARKAVASNNRLAAYHDTLGWVYQQRGEIELARASYGQALVVDAKHEAARRHLRALDTVSLAAADSVPAKVAPPVTRDRAAFATDVPQPPPIPAASSDPIRTQPAVPAPVAKPAPVVASPAPAEAVRRTVSDLEAQLEQRVDAWRSAWQHKRVGDYLSMYGAAFVPPSGMSRSAWEADRHRKLDKKGDIQVEISELETSISGATASTRFRQRYKSSNYADETRKTLTWALSGGIWKIVSEDSAAVQ